MPKYADVILPLPVPGLFTYKLPDVWIPLVKTGMRITVQFGRKKVYTAVIRHLHNTPPQGYAVKEVLTLPDEEPVVNDFQFRLWDWISDYYLCTLGEVCKAALPAGMKKLPAKSPVAKREKPAEKRRVPNVYVTAQSEGMPAAANILSEAQKAALDLIRQSFKQTDVVLLHGVTSSGKTEIYLQLIREVIAQGRQVLYLLPEIALTAQIVDRLRLALGREVAVYHSRFTDRERVAIWKRMLNGENGSIQVVLGARSAIFLPFHSLGLIIVDEEHENTFKQFDPAPRYHARDTAVMMARIHGANVLLGTATPSMESYANCRSGKYGLVELTERYGDVELPEVKVVNTRELRKKKQMQSHFSPALLDQIALTLEQGEQVILFQNRRGFSLFLECEQCGEIPRCKHCDVSLTYHKQSNRLICHYCGFGMAVPKTCPSCGNSSIKMQGFGTEKVEEEIRIFFPEARVVRMDLDSMRRRKSFEEIISRITLREADILVGTQMVSKGLDFEHVKLVGIVNADTMLNFPDFRAHERSFQLMSQVSGRAGRKGTRGMVIIQTSDHRHPVIDHVVRNDYAGLYGLQLEERKRFLYPPFCRLIDVTLKHRDREILDKAAAFLAEHLRQSTSQTILGPEYPLISRVQNFYLKRLLIKTEKLTSLPQLKQLIAFSINELSEHPMFRTVIPIVDVDPY